MCIVCVCVCLYLGAHMGELCGGQRLINSIYLNWSLHYFMIYDYRQVFSLNLKFVDLAKLAGPQAPGIFLAIWLLLGLQVHAAAPILFTWLMGVELKSFACKACTLSLRYLHPCLFFFNTLQCC